MFYKNRKGLSDVIATVLIILLAIAAIVIVWGFISNWLGSAGDNLGNQASCLDVDVKPISCVNSTKIVTVEITRGTPIKALVSMTLDDGSVIVNKTVAITSGQLSVNMNMSYETKSAKKAGASAVILNKEGNKEVTCTESPITVECV